MQSNVLRGQPGLENVFLIPLGLLGDLLGESSPRGTARSQTGNTTYSGTSQQKASRCWSCSLQWHHWLSRQLTAHVHVYLEAATELQGNTGNTEWSIMNSSPELMAPMLVVDTIFHRVDKWRWLYKLKASVERHWLPGIVSLRILGHAITVTIKVFFLPFDTCFYSRKTWDSSVLTTTHRSLLYKVFLRVSCVLGMYQAGTKASGKTGSVPALMEFTHKWEQTDRKW